MEIKIDNLRRLTNTETSDLLKSISHQVCGEECDVLFKSDALPQGPRTLKIAAANEAIRYWDSKYIAMIGQIKKEIAAVLEGK